VKTVGPGYTAFINKEIQTEEDFYRSIRQNEIDFCKKSIASEHEAQVAFLLVLDFFRDAPDIRPDNPAFFDIRYPANV
jgi:hypothetical protein